MRVALAIVVLGLVGLLGTSALWLRRGPVRTTAPDRETAQRALAGVASATGVTVDLAARYAGRAELVDPRAALPSWHRWPRDAAVATARAAKTCPPSMGPPEVAPALAKVLRWHARTCAGAPDAAADLVEQAPFLHPNGASYAALTLARQGSDPAVRRAFVRAHERAFHVTELASLAREMPLVLSPEGGELATWSDGTWEALARGDSVLLTADALVVVDRGGLGLGTVRAVPRREWEAFARERGLALVTRTSAAVCERPASPALCWEARGDDARERRNLAIATSGAALVVVAGVLALGVLRVRERRRAHADRVHVLRTLTHELRTPAMTLGLDMEVLRSAYDDLPERAQEPTLRLSDGIARLHRVLHRSARYMALFESKGAAARALTHPAPIASLRELFEDYAAEWPEGTTLHAPGADASFVTDADWLGVAVRNLAENGARHGTPPVAVSWAVAGRLLVVRVTDGGTTRGLRLAEVAEPNARRGDSEGLGLGLAIVQRVATLLGGRLGHEPAPTTFELRLPEAVDRGEAE